MLRMQFYVPEEIHLRLGQIKKAKKVSMGKLIRKYIDKGIDEETIEDNGLWKLADLGIKGGDSNLSKNYKEYLYGKWRGK